MLNEQMSAWVDGELHGPESAKVLEAAAKPSSQQRSCALCWLIGDVLRSEKPLETDFTHRVMAALEDEPTVLAPRTGASTSTSRVGAMRMAAAVAGAAVAVWAAMSLWGSAPAGVETIALHATPQIAALSSNNDVSNDRTYLMAHQAASMGVPMASVAQYIRTVGDDRQVGAR